MKQMPCTYEKPGISAGPGGSRETEPQLLPRREDQREQPHVIKAGGQGGFTHVTRDTGAADGKGGREGRRTTYFKVRNGKEGIPGRGHDLCKGMEV